MTLEMENQRVFKGHLLAGMGSLSCSPCFAKLYPRETSLTKGIDVSFHSSGRICLVCKYVHICSKGYSCALKVVIQVIQGPINYRVFRCPGHNLDSSTGLDHFNCFIPLLSPSFSY